MATILFPNRKRTGIVTTFVVICVIGVVVDSAPVDNPNPDEQKSGTPDQLIKEAMSKFMKGLGGKKLGPLSAMTDKPSKKTAIPTVVRRRGKSSRRRNKSRKMKIICESTSTSELLQMLGSAFNLRYMSVNRPPPEADDIDSISLSSGALGVDAGAPYVRRRHHKASALMSDQPATPVKTAQEIHGNFSVNENYRRELPDHVDAYIRSLLGDPKEKSTSSIFSRSKRRTSKRVHAKPSWSCPSKVVWKDLGDDHFPRYLRTVECGKKTCWVGAYGCKAKAFTLKVLKRVSDECKPIIVQDDYRSDQQGAAPAIGYQQVWVFEEIAVAFCCECARL